MALPNTSLALIGPQGCGKTTALAHLCQLQGGFSEELHKECKGLAKDLGRPTCQHAWMLDRLLEERERGMTVDASLVNFKSGAFSYTGIDTPGNPDFVKNMLSVTSLADVAILVIPAAAGEYEAGLDSGHTQEMALCAFAMGIKNIIVWVTKMDDPSVEFASSRFEDIKKAVNAFLKEVGYKQKDVPFIPISGRYGDNLVTKSGEMSWYGGTSALEALDAVGLINRPAEKPLRLPVLKVFEGESGTVVVGRVETGSVRTGTKVLFSPGGLVAEVTSIHKDGEQISEAKGGDVIGMGVNASAKDIHRGMVASSSTNDPAADVESFLAQVVVLDHPGKIRAGYCPVISVHTSQVPCEFEELVSRIDRKSKEEAEKNPEQVKSGDVVMVRMRPRKPVCIESFSAYPSLGRFAIRDHNRTVAIGVVKEVTKRPIPKMKTSGGNEYFDG